MEEVHYIHLFHTGYHFVVQTDSKTVKHLSQTLNCQDENWLYI